MLVAKLSFGSSLPEDTDRAEGGVKDGRAAACFVLFFGWVKVGVGKLQGFTVSEEVVGSLN